MVPPGTFMVPDDEIEPERLARAYSALANPVRLRILHHVARHADCCCKDLTGRLPLAQSTVSQHLKVLIEAGLIEARAVPPRSRYTINAPLLAELARSTEAFLGECCACVGSDKVKVAAH